MDWSLSEFLNLLELRGQSWCIVKLCGSAGFSAPHHDGVSFYAMLEGSARIAGTTGGEIDMRMGDIRMLMSGESHAVRTYPTGPVDILEFFRAEQNVDAPPIISIGSGSASALVLCGRLRISWPSGLRRGALQPVIDLNSKASEAAPASMRIGTLRLAATGAGAAALLTRFASLLLAMTLRNDPQSFLLSRLSGSSNPIARSLQLVASDPAADWSVATLAQRVGMSRSTFAARFAAEVGRTPMEVITERRMLYAAEMLEHEDVKIVEVSARAGYRSEAAFSRRFTRHFGVSPSEMRRGARRRAAPTLTGQVWQAVLASVDPRADRLS